MEEVKKLAARGLNEYQIALQLGIHKATLQKKKHEYPAFKQAIIDGKQQGISFVENKMFEEIAKGNASLIKFYLASHKGDVYSERSNVRITGGVHMDLDEKLDAKTQARMAEAYLRKVAADEASKPTNQTEN